MITLHDFELSGNCHKVRLMLSFLGLDHEKRRVDLFGGETHTEAFLRLNPRGQIPVLVDGETIIWDSQAILVYLARRYGAQQGWLPLEPAAMARVFQWLAAAENELQFGLQLSRAIHKMGRPGDLTAAREMGRKGLALLDGRLRGGDWLAGTRPTIADVACFPYTALAPEGGLPLEPWPAVEAWIARFKALPEFVGMPGIAA